MTIKNPRRKKRIVKFIDKDRGRVMDRYYELVTERKLNKETALEMMKLIGLDPSFYDPYLVISEYYTEKGKYKEARRFAKEAFERAIKRIVDYRGNFPKHMEWGWLENRHIIRAIGNWARTLWGEGKTKEALEMFRKLFQANPNDNTGCRYDILAMRMGLKHGYFEKKFASDAGKITNWFNKNWKKFPEEFDFWLEYLDDMEKINEHEEPDNTYHFDDCPICQEMKKAEDEGRSLTKSELKQAFSKAKNLAN